jgi:hypothetical protein
MNLFSVLPTIIILATTVLTITSVTLLPIHNQTFGVHLDMDRDRIVEIKAPIASSDENVYMAWWNGTAGEPEVQTDVMFRASNDAGQTFGDKINLSNTTDSDSWRVEIDAEGDNVYVSWWETNMTSDMPVARISNDGGETFGPMMMLGTNGTISGTEGEGEGGQETVEEAVEEATAGEEGGG